MSQEAVVALQSIGPAMIVAAVMLTIAWQPWRRASRAVSHGHWAMPVALGFGACAALISVTNWQVLQLRQLWHWLAVIALAAAALGLIASLWRPALPLRAVIGAATALAAGVLFHPPPIYDNHLLWRAGLGAAVFVLWLALEPLANRRGGGSLPIAMSIVFSGLSMLMMSTNQAGFSLLAAAIGAMCGVAFIIGLFNSKFTFAHGGIHVIATMLAAIVLVGWLYNPSEVSAGPFVLTLVAPLTLWIGELRMVRRLKPWQSLIIRAAAVAIPVSIAIIWAMVMASEADEYMY